MEQKDRYEILREKSKKQKWETNELFTECLAALGNDISVLSYEKSSEITDRYFNTDYSFSEDVHGQYRTIANEHKEEYFYLFWDNAEIPVICAPMGNILEKFDDVTAVGFDTYAVSLDMKTAVVFDHNDRIMIGRENE